MSDALDNFKRVRAQKNLNTAITQRADTQASLTVAGASSVLSKKEPVKYQHYRSSRASMRMSTTDGTPIAFIAHEFITSNPKCIKYLNDELELGLTVVTKGDLLTSEESDPMISLKKRIIAEYLTKEAEENAAIDTGADDTAARATTGILGTTSLPNIGDSSSSANA